MPAFSLARGTCSLGIVFLLGVAQAKRSCPVPVDSAMAKAYPGSRVSKCKKETEDGKTQYEVKLAGKGFRGLEIDVSPEGSILQTEEKVKVRAIPAAVASAFKSRYPTMKIARAQKQTKADGLVSYELAFLDKMKNHEATFSGEGSFVNEE